MASSLRDLVDGLMGTRDALEPSTQPFAPLDLEEVSRQLRLDDRAAEAAVLEHPTSDDLRPDRAELDIRDQIERRGATAATEYRSQIELYEGRSRRALITVDQRVSIEAAGQNAIADFKAQIRDDIDHLHELREQVEGRESEFQRFREKNALSRLPRLLSDREWTARILLLAIFVVAESIINGMFFAEGSKAGLIGGVVQALVLSLLNVGFAVLIGRFGLPLLYHRSIARKLAGGSALLLYALYAATLNVIIAHVRDVFIVTEGLVSAAEVTTRLATAPFALSDMQSWLLCMLGIALSILALLDSAGMDDLYPGFGAVGRLRQKAVREYAEGKTQCIVGLRNLRDGAVGDMIRVIELMRTSEFDLRVAIEGRDRLRRNYVDHLDHLTSSHERLVERYREVNRRIRTSPVPTYFSLTTARPPFDDPPVLISPQGLDQETHRLVIERMEYFISAVNHTYEQALESYQSLAHLTGLASAPA